MCITDVSGERELLLSLRIVRTNSSEEVITEVRVKCDDAESEEEEEEEPAEGELEIGTSLCARHEVSGKRKV
jgi:hypothetical protein